MRTKMEGLQSQNGGGSGRHSHPARDPKGLCGLPNRTGGAGGAFAMTRPRASYRRKPRAGYTGRRRPSPVRWANPPNNL